MTANDSAASTGAKIQVSLVVPFFNEEECAAQVVDDLVAAFEESGMSYELILVNNGSTDKTCHILDRYKAPHIQVIHKVVNEPFGGAIIDGMAVARGEYLGFTWGDGQAKACDIVSLAKEAERKEIAFVKGTRINRTDGAARLYISKVYNFICKMLLGIASNDVNGCPVFFKRAHVKELSLKFRNWGINIEILGKFSRKGINPIEIAIPHAKRRGGKSKVTFGTSLQMFKHVLEVRKCIRSYAGLPSQRHS